MQFKSGVHVKNILAILAVMLVLIAGCAQKGPIVGNDSDIHGCKASAGYSWCEAKQKCIRPFEENCTTACTAEARLCPDGSAVGRTGPNCEFAPCPQISGNDSGSNISIEDQARTFCGAPNVDKIYVCGGYVRVVSSLLGGGSTFYKDGKMITQCPVVGPDSMSEQCKLLLYGNNCVESEITCQMVGNDSDSHGCKASAGYSWCEAKQKCIRAWEEPCEGALTSSEVRAIADSACGSNLSDAILYNNNSKTYWIDINEAKQGCSPACVIWEGNKTAEINWRCTGAIEYTVKRANMSDLGEVLTDGSGMTLYVFTADNANKSNCAGACASNWPPLIFSGNIIAQSGIPGALGAILRPDNSTQATYNGMPLYRYSADNSPGDANGQGYGGRWFVAQTDLITFPK
jgi:predicted lipoprotein with Yx(FWY)xxD motif